MKIQKTNFTTNQTIAQSPNNTKKEESWLSKNAQLLGGIALGVVAIAVIYKLGQSASASAEQPKWVPLTDADKAPVADFDPVDYVSNPKTSPFDTKFINVLLNSDTIKIDFTTLFNFCINNKVKAFALKDSFAEDAAPSVQGCAEHAFSALSYIPPKGGDLTSNHGFNDYFPDLTQIDGQWVKKA